MLVAKGPSSELTCRRGERSSQVTCSRSEARALQTYPQILIGLDKARFIQRRRSGSLYDLRVDRDAGRGKYEVGYRKKLESVRKGSQGLSRHHLVRTLENAAVRERDRARFLLELHRSDLLAEDELGARAPEFSSELVRELRRPLVAQETLA